MNKIIYISGPYGQSIGASLETLVKNVTWANKYGGEMLFKGWHIYVPHNSHYTAIVMAHPLSWDKWMEECMFWLGKCRAILMTAGWERSEGSKRELAKAKELGLEVYYSIDDVPNMKEG